MDIRKIHFKVAEIIFTFQHKLTIARPDYSIYAVFGD